jgi:hypothetical protein
MSKQTAVDWLIENYKQLYFDFQEGKINQSQFFPKKTNIEEQAKHMEKWQIKGAYQKGRFSGQTNWGYGNDVTAEQYYNETYGGNNDN